MNNTLIYIDGTLIDLLPNTVVASTFKAFEIGDISARNSSYTNRFKIPKTATNKQIFGFSENIKSETNKPYTKLTGRVVQNGIEIMSDAAVVLMETNEYFNIELFSGTFSFFDLLGDRTLSDMLQDKAPQLTDYPFANSLLELIFFNSGNLDETNNPLQFDGRTAIKYLDVIEQIVTNNGYTKSGNIFNNETLGTLYMLAFGFDDKYNFKFKAPRESLALRDTSVAFAATSANQRINFTQVQYNGIDGDGWYNGTNTYQVTDPLFTGTFFYCHAYVVLVIDNIVFSAGATRLRVELVSSSGSYTIPNITAAGTYFLELSSNIAVDPIGSPVTVVTGVDGQQIYVQARTTDNIGTPIGTATVTFGNDTSFRIECLADMPTPTLYKNISGVLPELSQKEFMRDFAVRFGVLFRERAGVLECKTISEIISNRADAVNWTAKRDPRRTDEIVYEFRGYAQNNYFRYQSIDDLTDEETGQGNLEIANENLEQEQEIYATPFSSSYTRNHGNATAGFITCAHIPIAEGGLDANDPELRLLMVRDRRSYEPTLSGGNSTYRVGYFVDVDGQEGKDASFEHALEQSYSGLSTFLQKAKTVTRYYRLSVVDIASLDLFTLVYDDGAYFIINTVENFVPGQVTKVELFKVS